MSRRSARRSAGAVGNRPGLTPGAYEIDTGTAELVPDAGPPEHWLLNVNGVPSSTICPADPTWLGFEYLQIMATAIELTRPEHSLDVVHLGGAGCALAWALHIREPRARQLAIELDARLCTLVREWFDLPRSPSLRIRAGEARTSLTGLPTASADVIVRDVFAGDTTPGHVRTAEFSTEVARVLRPEGVYLLNVADRPPLRALWDEVATVTSVFGGVSVIAETAVLRGRRYGNAVLLATRHELPASTLNRLYRALLQTGLSLRIANGSGLSQLAAGGQVLHDPPPAQPVAPNVESP